MVRAMDKNAREGKERHRSYLRSGNAAFNAQMIRAIGMTRKSNKDGNGVVKIEI